MESLAEIMKELERSGSDQIKNTFLKHGAREPYFGVKVEDLKKIQKRIKKNHKLSIELFNTGNSDAMYLAGLIADEKVISKEELNDWVEKAYWYMISEYTVAQVAAETSYGLELAHEWIKSEKENIASSGWSTFTHIISIKEADEKVILDLFNLIRKNIHSSPDRVRFTMNGFIIAVGGYIPSLREKAIELAREIGKVDVDFGNTYCKIPDAETYINKMIARNSSGKKRSSPRC